jgi:hypothetical protein
MNQSEPRCIQCERDSAAIPLIQMVYRGQPLWICPEHLPLLIHKPQELVAKLPAASAWRGYEDDAS